MSSSILTYFKQASPSPEDGNVDYKRVFSEINNSSSSIDSEAVKSPETKRPNTLSAENEQPSTGNQGLNMQFSFLDSVKSMIGELSSTIDSRFLDNTDLINNQFSLLTPRFDTIDNRLSSIEEQAGMRDEKINALSERLEQLEQRNSVLEDRVRELTESNTAPNVDSGWSPAGNPGIKVKLLGDSNSAGKIKFGSGKGTLGSALPGSDLFVATVNDLPVPAQSHELFSDASDVVIAVGSNNLKNPECDPTLLESHSVPATEDSWRRSWEGDIYFNHGSSNSTGVTFLVKSNSDIKICSHKIIVQGRVSLLEIEHDSTNYCLVNVYCPNDNVTHVVESTFLNTLSRTRDDFCIFGGDWNTILDNNMDKHGGNRAHSNNNRQILLHQMMADHGLCDILRLCKGDDRIYTHVNKQHKTQTRLDFFLIDANIVNFPLCTPDISHGFKSDHSYISLTVQGTPVNRGKGYWKFNNQHLENENFVNEVRNIINATINSDHDSKSGLWDVIKFKIKDFAIRFGKKEKEKKDTERKKLIKEIEDIKKDTNFMQNDDLRQKFFDFESKLDDFIKQDINGAITRARIKWTEEGERSTKYFFGIEKSNAKKKSINKLIDSNNADLTSHTDISNHVVNFYQNLYNSTQSNA
ncbi:hypothetical protein ACHWQZ_G012561 [Mnemiopsis leidyi]